MDWTQLDPSKENAELIIPIESYIEDPDPLQIDDRMKSESYLKNQIQRIESHLKRHRKLFPQKRRSNRPGLNERYSCGLFRKG